MKNYFSLQSLLLRLGLFSILGISFFLLSAIPELPQNQEDEFFKTCAQNYPARKGWGAAFFDLSQGGTCWSCPSGYRRPATVYPVSSKKACVAYKTANKVGRYGCKNKYGGRAFFDAIQGGTCWTCPSGYRRTAEPVTHAKACAKDFIFGPWSRASKKGSSKCDKGIADPIEGGTCWTCPSGGNRTVFAVNGGKACEFNSKALKRGPDTQLIEISSASKAKIKSVTQSFANKSKEVMAKVNEIYTKVNGPLQSVFKGSSFANNVKNGNYSAIWNQIKADIQPLISKVLSLQNTAQFQNIKDFKVISISVGGAASVGAGMAVDNGIIIDFSRGVNNIQLRGFYKYKVIGTLTAGVSNNITVGIWNKSIDCGSGFSLSAGFAVPTPKGVSVGAQGSIAIDANKVCKKEWASFLNLSAIKGISISGTVGAGVDVIQGVKVGVAFSAQMFYTVSGGGVRKACKKPCGGRGQRACSVVEKFPSCNVGLFEQCGTCR